MRWKVARKKRNRTSSLWQRKEWISLSSSVYKLYWCDLQTSSFPLHFLSPLSPFPSLSLSCHPSLFFLITIIIICLRLPFYFSFFRFPRLSNSSILSLINHLMITKLSPVYTSLSSVSSRHKVVWTTGNESNGLGKVSEREREREWKFCSPISHLIILLPSGKDSNFFEWHFKRERREERKRKKSKLAKGEQ